MTHKIKTNTKERAWSFSPNQQLFFGSTGWLKQVKSAVLNTLKCWPLTTCMLSIFHVVISVLVDVSLVSTSVATDHIFLLQVRLRTEVPRTPSSTRLGFELMTSRSWQYSSCHWDACSNHSGMRGCHVNDYLLYWTPFEDIVIIKSKWQEITRLTGRR